MQLWVEKHRDHIQKLETLLRMLDNDQVEVQQIKDIQEDIDNYIENSQEPDFFENEFIYEDIEGLEEMLLDVMLKIVIMIIPFTILFSAWRARAARGERDHQLHRQLRVWQQPRAQQLKLRLQS